METSKSDKLNRYSEELSFELQNILKYWTEFSIDVTNGGFAGKISNENQVEETADKGAVLNARILWSFAAAYNLKAIHNLELADRAYHYITDHFIDKDFGGVYWTVDYEGNPKDTKKQVYALAFTIYALSEYFMADGNELVKEHAVALYNDLVKYSYDAEKSGYFEAFDREWQEMNDLRLSDKDANEKKTMNTHLHILEAFTNLYRIWPDEMLRNRIIELLNDFIAHIVNSQSGQMNLFFDENWNVKSNIISYGHDIEASWLLLEAAEVIGDLESIKQIENLALKMAEATLSGLDENGSLWYEKDPSKNHIVKQKHWWVQAEAMVGFFSAWQLSGELKFLTASKGCWDYIKLHIINHKYGEWFWGIDEKGDLMVNEDKIGLWKCPYHNSRACIEIIRRIKK